MVPGGYQVSGEVSFGARHLEAAQSFACAAGLDL